MKDNLQGGSTPNQNTSSQSSPEQMDEATLRELYRRLLALKGKPINEVVDEP